MPFLSLEHKLIKHLKDRGLEKRGLYIAVSGGSDSVGLAHLFSRLKPILKLGPISLVYIHHGEIKGSQGEYRDRAGDFVKQLALTLNCHFASNLDISGDSGCKGQPVTENYSAHATPSLTVLGSSEANLRDFRYKWLRQLAVGNDPLLILGHTREDLLESRMIGLIRGVGHQGLRSMRSESNGKLRPWLNISKREIKSYLTELGASWLEDPSNMATDPLRNWIREDWLPRLEKKHPGACGSIARSLETLLNSESEEGEQVLKETYFLDGALIRQRLMEATRPKKMRVLALFMQQARLKGYGQSHIEEVMKRLDSPRKTMVFSLLKRRWKVTENRIFMD